ncbi:RNA polymerase sigma factor [Streptomyces sp. NPDC048639]|uniref:RNA polymerase sigma factor n=1 Tax=Streptomyces sp. NPDC048639 TaxID=3365581 RepID=UPI003717A49A
MLGDDAELTAAVHAAQDGNETAFRTVYRAVHPRLLGYVRTLVSEPDAEDVASEAWLQIARDLERFSGDADRFRGWAARIARNRALDHIRMRGRRPSIGGDETELADKAADADTAREAMESIGTGRTLRLISKLPQDQAEAVVLRVVVGLDAKSAADVLGKRPGAVRTAAHRGLRRLAELIGVDEHKEGDQLPESAGDSTFRSAYVPGPAASATGVVLPPAPGCPSDSASGPAADSVSDPSCDPSADPSGGTGGLDGVPPQRERQQGQVTSAGVTDSGARTQKDM